MEKKELKKEILKIIEGKKLAGLATIKDNKPWVRYVMVSNKDLDFFFATGLSTRKIDQIKKNNNVHLTMGFDPQNPMSPYVQVEGTAEVLTDKEIKKEFWSPMLKAYFKDADDPEYCVVKIKSKNIELWASPGPDGVHLYKCES